MKARSQRPRLAMCLSLPLTSPQSAVRTADISHSCGSTRANYAAHTTHGAGAAYTFWIAAACLLAACGRSPTTTDTSRADTAVTELPLKRGFYVASDTACAAASNATLLLVRRDGFSGARDSCDFMIIERIGPRNYRVAGACAVLQAGRERGATQVIDWEIPDEETFSSSSDAGGKRSFRHCEQSSLPHPWRDNDISDLIGPPAGK